MKQFREYILEKQGAYPNHTIIMFSKRGDCRRAKLLYSWEIPQLEDGKLKYVFVRNKDTIIINKKYNIKCKQIPITSVWLSHLSLRDMDGKRLYSDQLLVTEVTTDKPIKAKKISEESKNGNKNTFDYSQEATYSVA